MSWPALVMYAVVLGVGVPAMWHNVTAFALVLSWATAQGLWYMTGDNLPLSFYFVADLTVIFIVYAKTISATGAKIYDSGWHQLRCMWTDLTPCDRWIVALFPLAAWPLYVLAIDPRAQWFALWFVTIVQFLLAGAEALHSWREARRADHASPDTPSPGGSMRLAEAGGGYG